MRPTGPAAVLERAKTPVFLVSDLINMRYLTGMVATAGFVLVRPSGLTLYLDSRYREAGQKVARPGIRLAPINNLEKALKKYPACGFEADDVTVGRVRRWRKKFKQTKFKPTTGVIEHFRRSKAADELRCFRRAQRITWEIMARVPSMLRRKLTEQQLAEKLRQWAVELGAEGLSFDPIVAFGTNTVHPHHRPTTRTLKKGHIVQIDCGAQYRGYCADQSQVFYTARPTPLQRRVYLAVEEAKDVTVAAVHAGMTNHDVDRITRDVLKQHKLEKYYPYAGHGIGLCVHEGPVLSQRAEKMTLLEHEIITIEPGVHLPGKFGMRLEQEVIVPR